MLSPSARRCSRNGTPGTGPLSDRATWVYAGNARTSRASAVQSPGDAREHRPPRDEQRQQRRRDETAPEVVEDLPARDDRQRVRHGAPVRVGDRAPEPARDLPVAADPSVQAGGGCEVVRRVVVDKVDVGAQPGAGVGSLEEIVAEQPVFRHPVRQRRFERVDIVNALADVAAFMKQILIDVRHGRCVRIDPHMAGEHLRERRAVGTDQVDGDARLEHAVAFGDALQSRVESRPVQRMRQRPDQATGGLNRQLCVGIQRDDVADGRQNRHVAVANDEAGARVAAKQPVELRQFAALALPSHPAPFAGIPAPLPVKQKEPIGAVPRVELGDPVRSPPRRAPRRRAVTVARCRRSRSAARSAGVDRDSRRSAPRGRPAASRSARANPQSPGRRPSCDRARECPRASPAWGAGEGAPAR